MGIVRRIKVGKIRNGDWMISITGRSGNNIAVIKYWGKRNEKLILPLNSSISITLDPNDLSATTTVAASPAFERDRLWLNGKEIALSSHRYVRVLEHLRERATDFADEQAGIFISKEEWKKLKLHIVSENNFPTAAGLASSAAGFSCLVFTISQLMGVKESYPGELTTIARMGSGSACRSLYGGFVKWNMGQEEDGKDSIAIQLAGHEHWPGLSVIIAIVSEKEKDVSSSAGMQESVQTSPLLRFRAKEIVPQRIVEMEKAIAERDFATFAELTCADSNSFHATCMDTRPPIFYMNDTSRKIVALVERWNRHAGTPQAAYTFDAGPNAVLFVPDEAAGALMQRLLYEFPPGSHAGLSSYVVGNTKVVEDAGIQSLQDVHSLSCPPESEKQDPSRVQGALSYLICTRPGRGSLLLDDKCLIDSTTGEPLVEPL